LGPTNPHPKRHRDRCTRFCSPSSRVESIQCKRRRQYLLYSTAGRQHLRSAGCHQLFVPRHRRSMFGRRACSVAGPAAWNSLPDYLRDPSRSADSFRRDLKTFLFSFCQRTQCIRAFAIMCCINPRFRSTLALRNTHRDRQTERPRYVSSNEPHLVLRIAARPQIEPLYYYLFIYYAQRQHMTRDKDTKIQQQQQRPFSGL